MPPPAHTPVAPPRERPGPAELPTELLQLVDSLSVRFDDLFRFQLPQLSQCDGPMQQHEAQVAGLRNELNAIKRDVEELKLQVDDLDRARDRRAGLQHVQHVQQLFDAVSKQYRAAVLASKKLIDQARPITGREELFASTNSKAAYHTRSQGLQPKPPMLAQGRGAADQSADDALMSATSDVTEGLRRTLQLMQTEVDRSVLTNEALEQQTSTLQMTNESYSTLSSLLNVSKALITSLEKADFLDRLILLAALVFFGLCCAYVFKRRVVDKGVRVAGLMGQVVGRTSHISGKLLERVVPGGTDILDKWLPSKGGNGGEEGTIAQVVDKVGPIVKRAGELVKRHGSEVVMTIITTVGALATQGQNFVIAKINNGTMVADDDDDDDDDDVDDDDDDDDDDDEEEEDASVVNTILPKDDKENKTAEPVLTNKEEVEPQTEQWVSKEEAPAAIVVEEANVPKEAVSIPLSEVEVENKVEEVKEPEPEPEKVVVSQESEDDDDDDDDDDDNDDDSEEEDSVFATLVESELVKDDSPLEVETHVEESKDVPVSDNTDALLEEEVTPVEEAPPLKEDINEGAEAPTTPEVKELLSQDEEALDTAPVSEAPKLVLEETTPVDAPVEAYDVSPPTEVELEPPFDHALPEVDATLITEVVEEAHAPIEESEVTEDIVDGRVEIIEPVPVDETAAMASEYPPAPTSAQEPVLGATNEEPVHFEATPTPPPEPVVDDATQLEEETVDIDAAATAPAQAEIEVEASLPLETESLKAAAVTSEEAMDDAFNLPGGSGDFGQDVIGGYQNATTKAAPEPEIEIGEAEAEVAEVAEPVVVEELTLVDAGTQTDGVEKVKVEEAPSQLAEVVPTPGPASEVVGEAPSPEEQSEKVFDPLEHQHPHRPTQYVEDAQQQIEENVVTSDEPQTEAEEADDDVEDDKDSDLLDFNLDDDADLEALLAPPTTSSSTTASEEPTIAEPVPAEAAVPNVDEAEEAAEKPAALGFAALPAKDGEVDGALLQAEETALAEEQKQAPEEAEQDALVTPTTTTEEAEPAEPAPAAAVTEETPVVEDEDVDRVKDEL